MRNTFAALPFLLALLVSAQGTLPTAPQGRIAGILLYPNGKPVPGGKVLLTGARPGKNPTEVSVETDQHGRFEFRHLRFTSYWFGPSKEDDANGDGEAVSVRGGVRLKEPMGVKLTPEAPTAQVVLRLGAKWGIISGTVEDVTTHRPVVARLRFAEQLGPGAPAEPHYLHDYFTQEVSGTFRILVPPAMDLFLEVDAAGYKPWFYLDGCGRFVVLASHSYQQALPLRFESGEQKSLDIALEITEDQPNGMLP